MKVLNLQQRFRQQAKNERMIRNALKRAEQIKAIRLAEELKQAEEARLNDICRKVAKSAYNPMRRISIQINGDIADFSVKEVAQKYEGSLAMTDSVWAPWNMNYKG